MRTSRFGSLLASGLCLSTYVVAAAVFLSPRLVDAAVVTSFDWNDGSVQGWTGSTSAVNVGNQLQVNNVGNGSLQAFSDSLQIGNWTYVTAISFDLAIASFSTVGSPGELVGIGHLLPPIPSASSLRWNLDMSGLAFNEWRTFHLALDDALGNPSFLSNDSFFSLLFRETSCFCANDASLLLDNFVITVQPVPEPSTVVLLCTGLAVGWRRQRLARASAAREGC